SDVDRPATTTPTITDLPSDLHPFYFQQRIRRLPTPTLFPYTTLFRSGTPARDRRTPRRNRRSNRRGSARRCGFGSPDPAASTNRDRKSTRLNSSHEWISYAVFCLKKKT